jgi:hypothetical protein
MYEIVKEYDMKNINQNIRSIVYKFEENEVLDCTKQSNQIFVSEANR